MSDGPHRSLPLRPGWKRTAERADTPAYEATEVTRAASRALEDDWRAEVPDAGCDSARSSSNNPRADRGSPLPRFRTK